LQPPAATGPVADANYLTGLQRTVLTVSDTSFAIVSGHNIRGSPAEGHTTELATSLVMGEVPSMASVYAYGMVYSAIAAY
jgi:hypothetical protein